MHQNFALALIQYAVDPTFPCVHTVRVSASTAWSFTALEPTVQILFGPRALVEVARQRVVPVTTSAVAGESLHRQWIAGPAAVSSSSGSSRLPRDEVQVSPAVASFSFTTTIVCNCCCYCCYCDCYYCYCTAATATVATALILILKLILLLLLLLLLPLNTAPQ
jgi:hypothetical protein